MSKVERTLWHRWSYVCGPGTPALLGQTIGQVSHFFISSLSQDIWIWFRRLMWQLTSLGTGRAWWSSSRTSRGTSASWSRRSRPWLQASWSSGSSLERDWASGDQTPTSGMFRIWRFLGSKQLQSRLHFFICKTKNLFFVFVCILTEGVKFEFGRYLTQFAAAKAGLILVNINPAYQPSELKYCLNKVEMGLATGIKTENHVFSGRCCCNHCKCKLQVTGLSQTSLSGIFETNLFMISSTIRKVESWQKCCLKGNTRVGIKHWSGPE